MRTIPVLLDAIEQSDLRGYETPEALLYAGERQALLEELIAQCEGSPEIAALHWESILRLQARTKELESWGALQVAGLRQNLEEIDEYLRRLKCFASPTQEQDSLLDRMA
jgi:hypothetical protein